MNIFSAFKSKHNKNKAEYCITSIFKLNTLTNLTDQEQRHLSKIMVESVWAQTPDVFNGVYGQRPHVIAVAAAALSDCLIRCKPDARAIDDLMFALCCIFRDLEMNGTYYPFNSLDNQLFETSLEKFTMFSQEYEYTPLDDEIESMLKEHNEWELWYSEYKRVAGEHNPLLATNAEGISIIDDFEKKPLRQAFADGIDPIKLGKQKAKELNFSNGLRVSYSSAAWD